MSDDVEAHDAHVCMRIHLGPGSGYFFSCPGWSSLLSWLRFRVLSRGIYVLSFSFFFCFPSSFFLSFFCFPSFFFFLFFLSLLSFFLFSSLSFSFLYLSSFLSFNVCGLLACVCMLCPERRHAVVYQALPCTHTADVVPLVQCVVVL